MCDPVVCRCEQIKESDIVTVVNQGVTTFLEICDRLPVARWCGSCTTDIMDVLNENVYVLECSTDEC
jgi:bacterioferritin-associated ferredoxin